MNAYTHHHEETNDRARGAEAIQARQRAQASASTPIRDRVRLAVSKRLISLAERLDAPQR